MVCMSTFFFLMQSVYHYRITDLLHYTPEEMVGRSIYSLVHGQDVILLKKCHLNCKLLIRSDMPTILITLIILLFSDPQRAGHVGLLPSDQQIRWLHLDANVRHAHLQQQQFACQREPRKQ